ncbi:MAG: 3-dehydroquinate synthase II [Euryarchaeota archaeon]|nr:3-dehydroquinate synthase II [Euryarchaeota archaeon]
MKFFWVDATAQESWDERKAVVTTALESGASAVVVRSEDAERARKLGNLKLVCDEGCDVAMVRFSEEELPAELESLEGVARLRELRGEGIELAARVEILSKAHERLAAMLAKLVDYLVVVGKDWKVIPLENLIAELQKEEVRVIAAVRSAEEARLALETLEVGTDGVLLEGGDLAEIKRVAELVSRSAERLRLVSARVVSLKQVGMGDRVCIDTASLLRVGEGMLVGSQAAGLFLVHSETLESEYVASRPFRVNAGAVHAYVLAPGGRTRYLSELKAGDEVLAVDAEGNTRRVVVGRVKIERRPLMLVEAEVEGRRFKTLLQNAETINLVSKDGKPISVAKLKAGDEVLLYLSGEGRHFGMEVEETVIER